MAPREGHSVMDRLQRWLRTPLTMIENGQIQMLPRTPLTFFEKLFLPAALLTLAAASSPISQLTLRPVFGAIPCSINHKQAVILTSILAFTLRYFFPTQTRGRVLQWTSQWTFWVPVIQVYLFRFSGVLGPVGGPILIGFLSCHAIIIPTVYSAAEFLELLNWNATFGPFLAAVTSAIISISYLMAVETWIQSTLQKFIAYFSNNPVTIQIALAQGYTSLATLYTPLFLSRPSLLAAPAFLHICLLNPHLPIYTGNNILNGTLQTHNWTLLDRKWSNTGYVSVLENLDLQYRVMRCDHSLLGGEWQVTDARRREGWMVNEPIYSVFEMMEAVRLMERNPTISDAEAQALVIGLGTGTAPKAFITHGINTTIVELDPVVHEYATTYFGLPQNHTSIIADAVQWAESTAMGQNLHYYYDYIIHDVFTGGVEPLALFTEEFLRNLRSLLKSNGVIALNYAGDISLPLAKHVLNTIDKVFNGQCKIYREASPQPAPSSKAPPPTGPDEEEDFANMVIFCRNQPGPISFRPPTSADFLGSHNRQEYLLPDPNLEIQFPLSSGSQHRSAALETQILKAGDEKRWSHQQAESAIKHWYIMRNVVPDVVWELW